MNWALGRGELVSRVPARRIATAQFRYFEIQPKTIDLSTRLGAINPIIVYSPEPRTEACCFRLNFKISKLGYFTLILFFFLFVCFFYSRFSRNTKMPCPLQSFYGLIKTCLLFSAHRILCFISCLENSLKIHVLYLFSFALVKSLMVNTVNVATWIVRQTRTLI